jgi:phage baseplate assembly protein W
MAFNPQTVNPYNLNPNIGIGINIPFNSSSPSEALFYSLNPNSISVIDNGVFTLNYNINEAIKNNLINFFLTNPGELPLNPTFGGGLRRFIFQQINEITENEIKNFIQDQIDNNFPQIKVLSLNILIDQQNNNTIVIDLKYKSLYSGGTNTVTFTF